MRYLGNKTSLVEFIEENVPTHLRKPGTSIYDGFSGTATVGRHFRSKDYYVESSDIMYMSYVLQKLYVEYNPSSKDLARYSELIAHLNETAPTQGYVWENFSSEGTAHLPQPRMFFLPSNAKKIDGIRQELTRMLGTSEISEIEFFAGLGTLLETMSLYANVSGVYAAFLKKYDPRALKPLELRPLSLEINPGPVGKATWGALETLAPTINTNVLYLDPPYNARQYAPNYHVLETVARYDSPVARGVSGLRDYTELKSDFCSKSKAPAALSSILDSAQWEVLLLSYNSDGIMSTESIISLLERYGDVNLCEREYRRYKSNHGEAAHVDRDKPLREQLYVVKR